jgi:drug/metabolite transporter (DMT)-like permease
MLLGLSRLTAFSGSLLLNLEAPFTMLLAVLVFREHLGLRATIAGALILSGALVLKLTPGELKLDISGVLLIAGACACWATDNNLTQRLSMRDPFAIVRVKSSVAGAVNVSIATFWLGAQWPSYGVLAAALALGAVSYGLSVVLDAYALRLIGAAREAAYFATAPFLGAIVSILLLKEPVRGVDVIAMFVMGAGVVLLLRERHGHAHVHEEVLHEHSHRHDEHHQHEHSPDTAPGEPHSHLHRHEPLAHDHAHVPDAHHRHSH